VYGIQRSIQEYTRVLYFHAIADADATYNTEKGKLINISRNPEALFLSTPGNGEENRCRDCTL
jgi:hypothetical protein